MLYLDKNYPFMEALKCVIHQNSAVFFIEKYREKLARVASLELFFLGTDIDTATKFELFGEEDIVLNNGDKN